MQVHELPRVIGLRHGATGEIYFLEEGEPTRVGSSPEANHIAIDDCLVSRSHLRICRANGQVMVEDLGSRNGTFRRGERIATCALEDGEVLHIGRTELVPFASAGDRWQHVTGRLHAENASFLSALETARDVCATTGGVVLRGEPGTGRSLMASAVHDLVCGHAARSIEVGWAPLTGADACPDSEATRARHQIIETTMSLPSLWSDARHGSVVLRGLYALPRGTTSRVLPQVLHAAARGWLHFVIVVVPGCPTSFLPSSIPIVDIPTRSRPDTSGA